MALSNAKKAIMKAKINGVIEQILVATSTENVMVDDTTTLAAFLTSLQTTINGKATTEQLNAVSGTVTALQTFVGSLPEGTTATTVTGYVAEAIAALNIGDYAKAADLTALAARVTALEGKAHEHANKAVLDDITAEKVAAWDGKANVYFAASQPENLAEGDLWFQLV